MMARPPLKPHYGISFTPANTVYPLKGQFHEPKTIDWLWGMLNKFPKARPQLRNSQNAAARMYRNRNKTVLPPRKAYQSTVDYYEAYLPLFAARKRFLAFTNPSSFMGHVMGACKSILPTKLF